MAEAADRLEFCRQALGELGTRSTITSLDPPDGSQESFYCNLFFESTRNQILRAAHWNFAGHSDRGHLWKALPGTPENPTIPANYQWSNRDPAPPWLYSYTHNQPGNDAVIQIRRVRAGAAAGQDTMPPLYGGAFAPNGYNQHVPFEVATDGYDRAGRLLNVTQTLVTVVPTAYGLGYRASDYITMVGDANSLMGQPVLLHITGVGVEGNVMSLGVADGGTFTGDTITLSQSSTTGSGTGFAAGGLFGPHPIQRKIILTNARDPIIDSTIVSEVATYDALFEDAFMLALEGKLALALLGDRALYGAKLQEANAAIINARVRDGNEGLTTYDFVPDWIQARGVTSAHVGGWLPAYGPLFTA